MKHTCRRVGGAYVVRATALGIQKISFCYVIRSVIVFLISQLCGSYHWLWSGLLLVCFFFLYLLQNLQFDFFVVGNFLSVFILLVYIFFFFVFLQKFYLFSTSSFNFNLPNIIFSNLVLILLNFQAFCEIDFFSISHFNKKFVFIFYFNFDFQYFDSFLGSFIQLIFLFKYTFQSKIKFVLYCNFDSCFFNCHLFFVLDPFMQLIFFFQVPFMQLIFFFQVNPLLFNWLRTAFRSCFR